MTQQSNNQSRTYAQIEQMRLEESHSMLKGCSALLAGLGYAFAYYANHAQGQSNSCDISSMFALNSGIEAIISGADASTKKVVRTASLLAPVSVACLTQSNPTAVFGGWCAASVYSIAIEFMLKPKKIDF